MNTRADITLYASTANAETNGSVELATFFKAAVAQNVRHTGFKTINPLSSITSEYQIHLVTLFTKSASATER